MQKIKMGYGDDPNTLWECVHCEYDYDMDEGAVYIEYMDDEFIVTLYYSTQNMGELKPFKVIKVGHDVHKTNVGFDKFEDLVNLTYDEDVHMYFLKIKGFNIACGDMYSRKTAFCRTDIAFTQFEPILRPENFPEDIAPYIDTRYHIRSADNMIVIAIEEDSFDVAVHSHSGIKFIFNKLRYKDYFGNRFNPVNYDKKLKYFSFDNRRILVFGKFKLDMTVNTDGNITVNNIAI